MNVSTSSAAAAASTSDVSSSSRTSAKASSSSKAQENSFESEMKTASETDDASKNIVCENEKDSDKDSVKDANKISDDLKKVDNDIVSSDILTGEINFTDYKYNNQGQSILSQNIQNLINTKDLMNTVNSAVTIDYDVINMSENDANFFADLVQNTDMSMKNIAVQISDSLKDNATGVEKNVQVSSILMEKLSDSMKTNQPFRIDFDNDVSVILKVNKDGSLAANFIPGDKAVEQYLRNNIASLRQRFDEQNLPYTELNYSNSRRQQQQRQRNNKENNNE